MSNTFGSTSKSFNDGVNAARTRVVEIVESEEFSELLDTYVENRPATIALIVDLILSRTKQIK